MHAQFVVVLDMVWLHALSILAQVDEMLTPVRVCTSHWGWDVGENLYVNYFIS